MCQIDGVQMDVGVDVQLGEMLEQQQSEGRNHLVSSAVLSVWINFIRELPGFQEMT